jgi:dipeptidase E
MGSCSERLIQLTRGGRRAALIANATDEYPSELRAEGVAREIRELAAADLDAEELDLRRYFDTGITAADLADYDLLWVRGGDTFLLRYTLKQSGADEALTQLLVDDAVVYGGYSAGVCVLAPSLTGLERVDEPATVERMYRQPPIWSGLGVLPYSIVPHVEDVPADAQQEGCAAVAAEYRHAGRAHKTLRDGEVLIIDGDAEWVCP